MIKTLSPTKRHAKLLTKIIPRKSSNDLCEKANVGIQISPNLNHRSIRTPVITTENCLRIYLTHVVRTEFFMGSPSSRPNDKLVQQCWLNVLIVWSAGWAWVGSGAICQNLCRRHDRFRVSEFEICVGNNIFSSKGIYGKTENNDKFTYLRLEYIIIIPTLDFTHRKNGHQGSVASAGTSD